MTSVQTSATLPPSDVLAACESLRRSYSGMPIGSSADWTTHPDALAAVAILHGLEPAAVTRCRVLELGCACGGNIVPLAVSLPHSRFVGVDISDVQIQMARDLATQAGARNLELRAANILDLDESLGEFDYILCDGVFSWVPAAVQDQILRLFARCLAPGGIAYLSFNAYPGWHVRGIVRDLLRIHTDKLSDAPSKTAAARKLLAELETFAAMDNSPLALIRSELDVLRDSRDSYLYHEHLVQHNTAFFFSDVMQRAAAHGLAYLSDVHPLEVDLEQRAAAISSDRSDRVQLRQSADFLDFQQYHCSLLCRNNIPIAPLSADRLRSLMIGSDFRPLSPHPDVTSSKPEEFTRPEGNLTTAHPFVKTALVILSRCRPKAMTYAELWQQAREELACGPDPFPLEEDVDENSFAEALLYCYQRSIVGLRTDQPDLSLTASDQPSVSRLARLQAESDESVANLLHSMVKLTPLQRQMLPYLDGTRDRRGIHRSLMSEFSETSDGNPAPSEQQIDEALTQLAAQAMLLCGPK